MGDELIYVKHAPDCGKNKERYQRCSCPVENPIEVEEIYTEDRIWVINYDGTAPLFCGLEGQVVEFLENNPSDIPRIIYITSTNDFLSESEFLDLAS